MLLAGGCASGDRGLKSDDILGQPALPAEAFIPLDKITPAPMFEAQVPTSDQPAPLELLELFAQAREELLASRRFSAIPLIQKAIATDGGCFELYYELGIAQTGIDDKGAIDSFAQALNYRPQALDCRIRLGRLYAEGGDSSKAIQQLRLARLTTAYKTSSVSQARVNLLLAQVLDRAGYLQASLDCMLSLDLALGNPSPAIRNDLELLYHINRPELRWQKITVIAEKLHQWTIAQDYLHQLITLTPHDPLLRRRLFLVMIYLRKPDKAMKESLDFMVQQHASKESVALLVDVYQAAGRQDQLISSLKNGAASDDPDRSRAILLALADVLMSRGQVVQAEQLLLNAMGPRPTDLELTRRLVSIYQQQGETGAAIRLLILASAANPDMLRQSLPYWQPFLHPAHGQALRLSMFQAMTVPPEAEASRLYWMSRFADYWNRDSVSRSSLEKATKIDPPFGPAYRALLNDYWRRPQWDMDQQWEASRQLADHARLAGREGLSEELLGLASLNAGDLDGAMLHLTAAQKAGNYSPDVQLLQANILVAQKQFTKAEKILWKLVSDWPAYDDAYQTLFYLYAQRSAPAQAMKVLQTWNNADPTSISARVLQAFVQVQAGKPDLARRILLQLFSEMPEDPDVLEAMSQFFARSNATEDLVQILEDYLQKSPRSVAVISELVQIQVSLHHSAEASRTLDAAVAAMKDDADSLYLLASLYTTVGQPEMTEQVLGQVLELDADHAAANNDLGYSWADRGIKLEQAEQMIRRAVTAEADNQSFLDSLGWVLYKRGQFQDALQQLQGVVGQAARPDPVVLDHLGDTLYQLGQKDQAEVQWKRALDRVGASVSSDDNSRLRLNLIYKIRQSDQKQPVTVAPVAVGS